ncbi:DUF2442 domain-containing protein [bacterium]|nr:DUF2442 domain-containing protein [bacterium]
MHPCIKEVTPNSDYTLTLVFANGEMKVFDVKPYIDKGIFQELRDPALFNSVKPFLGSIQWKNGQDFCPDTLYLSAKSIGSPLSRELEENTSS